MDEIQTALFHAALSSNPPMLTDDPVVNWEVDNMMTDTFSPYDPAMYREEIRAWRNSGGLILSYTRGN